MDHRAAQRTVQLLIRTQPSQGVTRSTPVTLHALSGNAGDIHDDAILNNVERGHLCFDVIRASIMWVMISQGRSWNVQCRFATCANLRRGVAACTSEETGAWTAF